MTHINYIILILIRNIKQITKIFAHYATLRVIQAAASAESAEIEIRRVSMPTATPAKSAALTEHRQAK